VDDLDKMGEQFMRRVQGVVNAYHGLVGQGEAEAMDLPLTANQAIPAARLIMQRLPWLSAEVKFGYTGAEILAVTRQHGIHLPIDVAGLRIDVFRMLKTPGDVEKLLFDLEPLEMERQEQERQAGLERQQEARERHATEQDDD
jgi:hypothetical protein